ncbi:MAG: hypothetical protein WCV86_01695 [Patescibacteria group bacterium]|jgi:hypothetical protein
MIIPLFIPIVLTFLFAAAIAVISGFQMYHVYSFGVWDKTNIGVAAIFLIFSVTLIAVMIMLIVATDWSQPITQMTLPFFSQSNAQ